jgi:hypothetical protein
LVTAHTTVSNSTQLKQKNRTTKNKEKQEKQEHRKIGK